MSNKCIICDIDGTLADLSHRLHHIKENPPNWDAFFSEMHLDEPIIPTINLINMVDESNKLVEVLFVSGRPDNYREITEKWLSENLNYGREHIDRKLYMRPIGDYREDSKVKSEIIDQILSEGYEVLFAIDDRPRVVAMLRSRGIFVFKVGDWEEDSGFTKATPGKLTLMIGPTGAGKSSWLKGIYPITKGTRGAPNFARHMPHVYGIKISQIISSDELRAEICGNFRDQSQNNRVFTTLHHLTKARIECGLDVVVDATNLRREDRRAVIDSCNPSSVRYIVMNRPIEVKLLTGGWRINVPNLIKKHEQRFQSSLKEILTGDGGIANEVIDLRILS